MKYRFEYGTLFEYSPAHKAFLACFTCYKCTTLKSAVKAHEATL